MSKYEYEGDFILPPSAPASTVTLHTMAFAGVEPQNIDVQVQVARGTSGFSIVGLANKSVVESKQRIMGAFASLAIGIPGYRITVNLSPTDFVKDGNYFDLPIALGLLAAMQLVDIEELFEYVIIGELALNGDIRSVNAVLPVAIAAASLGKGIICPTENAVEAQWSGNESIIAASNLLELIKHLKGHKMISMPSKPQLSNVGHGSLDMQDIKGHKFAKRALEVAAAGGHNTLMIGPPGSGKSMLARRFPTIMPDMTADEILEASIIASIAGEIKKEEGLVTGRPYREPHSSSSMPAMVGGGRDSKPGEITLAHLGVLFLDELPEFGKNVLEALRQPLEAKSITIARVNAHITYPTDFILIAAMNPCKCGYFGTKIMQCSKSPQCASDYQNKVSGPLWDRFDMIIGIEQIDLFQFNDIDNSSVAEQYSSTNIKNRVEKARLIQLNRYSATPKIKTNALAEGTEFDTLMNMQNEAINILKKYAKKHTISCRSLYKIIKLARTIADLDNNKAIEKQHITEALMYRMQKLCQN